MVFAREDAPDKSFVVLDPVHLIDTKKKILPPGDYIFYESTVGVRGDERWAILADNPSYGIRLERLRALDRNHKGILEAAKKDGKRYFA
jgi:hypothetical protein